METRQNLPILSFASQKKWEEWLGEHHQTSKGLWLKIAKKGAEADTVQYAEALEVALAYGWIDGQKGALDADFWLQKFTPRGPRSKWSKINREKATALIESGRMKPAGLAEVERARADGRWEAAYDAQSKASVPEDLQRELDANPGAAAFFATLESYNRYAILYRIQDAKKPETRARRIETFIGMLKRGEKVHP
ncbi:MAG TPA: YdeI/OmpD-associated family protein [Thermoanaerobaculia bacterium]|nr:YdeI/OmpD-associated family protein [Thermoanaerobaculia bacterium]